MLGFLPEKRVSGTWSGGAGGRCVSASLQASHIIDVAAATSNLLIIFKG